MFLRANIDCIIELLILKVILFTSDWDNYISYLDQIKSNFSRSKDKEYDNSKAMEALHRMHNYHNNHNSSTISQANVRLMTDETNDQLNSTKRKDK